MTDKARILFVDDEKRVLNAMRGLFRRKYDLFLTCEGAEAVRIAEENDVDVIVADQRMPGMTGVEVLGKVKEQSPRTVRILLTGYADPSAVEGSINIGEVFRFLSKPCPPKTLRETLALAVEASGTRPIEAPIPAPVATPEPKPETPPAPVDVEAANDPRPRPETAPESVQPPPLPSMPAPAPSISTPEEPEPAASEAANDPVPSRSEPQTAESQPAQDQSDDEDSSKHEDDAHELPSGELDDERTPAPTTLSERVAVERPTVSILDLINQA